MMNAHVALLFGVVVTVHVAAVHRAEQAPAPSRGPGSLRPARSVVGTVLTSLADPPIRIEVKRGFKYAGGQRFILREIADAEQHFFVDADSRNAVRRLYWIQFEQFLEGRGGQYSYDGDRPLTLAGVAMRAHVRRFAEPPAPDSDRRRAYDLLERAGYAIPSATTRVRFVYLPTPDRRQEVMIVYLEPAGTAVDLTAEASAAITQRATAGLSISR